MENLYKLEMCDIEEIILGMADIVHENRLLRKANAELAKDLKWHERSLQNTYEQSKKETANLLRFALDNALKD